MLSEELRQGLIQAAKAAGYASATELLISRAVSCAYFQNAEDLPAGKVGISRAGGAPDLPEGMEWPAGIAADGGEGAHADFLAQFRLADLPPVDGLPHEGHLWFFLRALDEFGQITVHHQATDGLVLRRREKPSGRMVYGAMFDTRALVFSAGISLPWCDPGFCDEVCSITGKRRADPLMDAFAPPGDSVGQIGGFHYSSDGGDFALGVGLVQLGRQDLVSQYGYRSVRELERARSMPRPSITQGEYGDLRPAVEWVEQHRDRLDQWRLLIRFDTNTDIGLSIGDSYPMGVFIRDSDLAARDFGKTATSYVR